LRAENISYAAAVAILSAWLVLSAGAVGSQFHRTAPPSPVPLAAPTTLPAPAPPRVVAEITVDDEHFYVLLGDGPPTFGVAVSASD
jgi:cell division protein FtsN